MSEVKHRKQRQECPVCGNRVWSETMTCSVRITGAKAAESGSATNGRCPGRFDPPVGGTIRPVNTPASPSPARPPSEEQGDLQSAVVAGVRLWR